MKLIKGLDYSFLLLITYIIKSVVLPAGITDICIAAILGIVFLGRLAITVFNNTKVQLDNNRIDNERFQLLELHSEDIFKNQIAAQVEELADEVSSVKQSINLRNATSRK